MSKYVAEQFEFKWNNNSHLLSGDMVAVIPGQTDGFEKFLGKVENFSEDGELVYVTSMDGSDYEGYFYNKQCRLADKSDFI